MKKTSSKKILQWSTKDVVLNVITYVLNAVFLTALLLFTVYANGIKIEDYLSNIASFLHFLILLIILVALMAFYFAFEDRDFMKSAVNSEMLFLIVEISLVICLVLGIYIKDFGIYLRPLSLVGILTLFLTNRRTAIFMTSFFCILMFLFDSFGAGRIYDLSNYPVLIMGFSSGIIAIFCMDKVSARLKLLYRSVLISVPTLVCVLMAIIEHNNQNFLGSLICAGCSGPLSVTAFIILLPIFEAMFKRVSSFKLAELTDHKSKLIKRMIRYAPGTFNHSIVVSNIAEACASAIGEDAMLARTCAYYHDVGKLRRPEFFKENQADGVNPHDDLTPELSANIIKAHAQDGYQLIMKNRLPKEIADICLQHHGTLPILYFYDKARKFTDGEVDLAQYCYSGPKPQTKIAAIIMIADGCEAAARALVDRSRENVTKQVRKIVSERMELGQFEECEITLKEINIIIHTVVNNLTGIYHNRIEYPKVNLEGMDL